MGIRTQVPSPWSTSLTKRVVNNVCAAAEENVAKAAAMQSRCILILNGKVS